MFQKWIIIAILISLMSGAAFFYYKATQNRIESLIEEATVLQENNKQLITANQSNLKAIDDLQSSYQKVQEDFSRVQSEFQIIRMQNNELRERLGRHELDALAAAKPGLVERTINNASLNALRCFELMSGSPLTERERNARNEREFNSECPWLFSDLVTR
jgi:regulator of replication initiation timing